MTASKKKPKEEKRDGEDMTASKKWTKAERRDMVQMAQLGVATAALGVGIVALLNERGDEMTETRTAARSPEMELKVARQQKRDAAKQRRATKATAKAEKTKKQTQIRQYAASIGYDGPIILLNDREYGIVPLDSFSENRKPADNKPKNKSPRPSWVAMEMNVRTGGDRQAIVCGSREEARSRALAMKRAHRPGSQQCKDCRQGFAMVDTSRPIDVRSCVKGGAGGFVGV